MGEGNAEEVGRNPPCPGRERVNRFLAAEERSAWVTPEACASEQKLTDRGEQLPITPITREY